MLFFNYLITYVDVFICLYRNKKSVSGVSGVSGIMVESSLAGWATHWRGPTLEMPTLEMPLHSAGAGSRQCPAESVSSVLGWR